MNPKGGIEDERGFLNVCYVGRFLSSYLVTRQLITDVNTIQLWPAPLNYNNKNYNDNNKAKTSSCSYATLIKEVIPELLAI